jgi:hypothetical protein
MADLLKSISKLEIGGDGRAAENYNSYKVQLENALSAKELQGYFLDDILLNTEAGTEVSNPGSDEGAWIATAPNLETRSAAEFLAARAAFSAWSRANRVTHSYIMATLPSVLHEDCAQRTKAHELWAYLEQRFAGQTLSSVAALWGRLLLLKLDEFPGVSAFLTAITKLELEIKRSGVEVPDSLIAGAILIGMGDRYPTTKELLLTLPMASQTKQVFGERLLEAEKNAKLSADISLTTTSHAVYAAMPAPSGMCGYVRQRQGKGMNAQPGTKCTRNHQRKGCWAYLDDLFLEANPSKTAADLPNRLAGLRAKQAGGNKVVAASASGLSESYDVNSAAINLSNVCFDYSGSVVHDQAPRMTRRAIAAASQHSSTEKNGAAKDITVVLDSGASVTCWKEKLNYQPLATPVGVNGAGIKMSFSAHGTSTVPCPSLPQQQLRGLYSPEFRHNLVSVRGLQKQGVEVAFPAHQSSAECRDPATGKVLWTFKHAPSGLYEAQLPSIPEGETAGAVSTSCQCNHHTLQHPSILLHYRLGHMSEGCMRTLVRTGGIEGLPKTFTAPPKELHSSCLPCIEGKTQAKSHPLVRSRARALLSKVHVDLVGPKPSTLKGERYCLTIVDDHSRYGFSVLLHTKEQAKHRIMEWIANKEKQTGKKVQQVHGDRGGEFLNELLLQHFRSTGVSYSFSNPHSPEQNGVAEARNKATGRILRTLLLQSEAPRSLWGYAIQHATHLNNLFPHGLLEGRTPYEVWHGTKPSMRRLRVWGCTGHVLMNAGERRQSGGKLGPVTKPCVLVGLNPLGPGWLLLDGATNREVPSSDVVFHEDVPFYRRRADRAKEAPLQWFSFDDELAAAPQQQSLQPADHAPAEGAAQVPSTAPDILPQQQQQQQPEHEAVEAPPFEPRRSARLQGIEPDNLPPSNIKWAATLHTPPELPARAHALIQSIVCGESGDKKVELPVPGTWQDALGGAQSEEWMESMVREYQGILNTGTLEAVPRAHAKNVVKCKWVYRIKRRPDGQPHFKSRLVAKGYSQKQGVDFFETWAPTARHTTARVFLHLAAVGDMAIHAMDVDQAFLQGDLEEEIFMEPAPGISNTLAANQVWRLKKPLYGLKQAPRQWQTKLKVVLTQLGLKPSHSDPSLYTGTGPTGMWLLVYVDDLLMACKESTDLASFKASLQQHFPMKDLGVVTSYLGMEVNRNRGTRQLFLSQARYIQDLLVWAPSSNCSLLL